jgi:hypothetical protein
LAEEAGVDGDAALEVGEDFGEAALGFGPVDDGGAGGVVGDHPGAGVDEEAWGAEGGEDFGDEGGGEALATTKSSRA